MRASVGAYAGLVETFVKVSGPHLSMIRNDLTKPAEGLAEHEFARVVSNPNAGVVDRRTVDGMAQRIFG